MTVLPEDEDIEEPEEQVPDEDEGGKPLDVSLIAKALVLTGLVILVIYLILRYLAVTTYADGSWRVFTLTQPGVFEGVVVISCVFLIFGAIAYFIHLQFVKLAQIAEEVVEAEKAFSEEGKTEIELERDRLDS